MTKQTTIVVIGSLRLKYGILICATLLIWAEIVHINGEGMLKIWASAANWL